MKRYLASTHCNAKLYYLYMTAIWQFLIRYYKGVLAILGLMLVGAIYAVCHIDVDNSLKIWFLENDPVYERYHDFQNRYGNDELISALVVYDKPIWDTAIITNMMKAEAGLKKIKGVDKVYSFASSPYLQKGMFKAQQRPILSSPPSDTEELEGLQLRLAGTPLVKNMFISKDEKAIVLLIRLQKRELIDKFSGQVLKDINYTLTSIYPKYHKIALI